MKLCRGSAKQTIPSSVLARNQSIWTRDLRRNWKWGRKAGPREAKEELAKGDAEGSRHRTAEETSRREIESRGSEEDRQCRFAVLSRQWSAVRKTVKD